jgi:2-polyprenyl-3-methyl-5-hydroxy-6-metoxy-1,4-benzoquinol methylase
MKNIQSVYSYWNDRPCNIRHSDSPQDSLSFFEEVSAKKYKAEPHKLDFLNINNWKDKWVLELGCGIGTDAVLFAAAGANIVCVDLTSNAIKLCSQNFKLRNLSGEFYIGNIEELDTFLPEKYKLSFDLVYSFGVIHHTPNPSRVIEQVRKFIKPSGEFRFMVYSRVSYKLFWLMNSHSVWNFSNSDDLIQRYSEAQSGCPVTYTYTFGEVAELLGTNFSIDKIWKDHIFKYDIENYKKNIFVEDKAFESVDQAFFKSMEKELGWHTMCIAIPSPLSS